MVSRVVNGATARYDIHDSGPGRIVGTTRQYVDPDTSTPLGQRRVRLHEQRSGRLVQEVWSDPVTGAYTFDGVRFGRSYYVIAFDHTGLQSGVIETDVVPEVVA